ncbi:delta 1-pyrroline-5-carboxylate reductase [Mortierella sp. GBA30]|nr:delta 1-pyrroline-5-carboxylate reductase [Mortierella sp. GBA30]
MPLNRPTICVLGCGTMGIAIIRGTMDSIAGADSVQSSPRFANAAIASLQSEKSEQSTETEEDPLRPAGFIACVSHQESALKLRKTLGDQVRVLHGESGNVRGVCEADVILLCTKPQVAKAVLSAPGIQEALTDKLLVSICAGVTIEQLQSWTTPTTTIIRAMPNTPCKIREGMTVLSCGPNTDDQCMKFTSNIFSTLGRCRILDEKHLDAVTALAGSGPAFACVMLEALADGGVMMGLPRDVATELAAQVLQGAARMVLTTGSHPAAIKDSVTTPGGCTIAGLLTMEDGKIRSTLARTIQEAATVASTLGLFVLQPTELGASTAHKQAPDRKATHHQNEQIKDRILGCLYGNAVGDAYGLATEFMTKKSARERYGNGPIAFGTDQGYPVWLDSHRSKWDRNDFTDDTDQMLLLLQSLQQTKDGRLHATNFAGRLKEWSILGFPEMETPPRGIGYTVGSTLTHPEFKFNPHKAAFDIWDKRGRNLAANGAVMRTSVLGIESFWDEPRVVENALAAAKVTHADPRAIISALLSSVLVSRLLRGGGTSVADDATRSWNPELASTEYKEELLDYLRRGTDVNNDQSLYPPYESETADNAFKNKKGKPVARRMPGMVADSNLVDRIKNLFLPSTPARYSSDDWNKDRPEVVMRADIGWAGMDEVGEDDALGSLARSVLNDYAFLILDTDIVPPIIRINEQRDQTATTTTTTIPPLRIQDKWFHELESSCFPSNLAQLELFDSGKMGYAFKCIGIGYYSVTRRVDPQPTGAEYDGPAGLFRGVMEQVTLEAGDADTNGAVVGSLLGARFGLSEGIPPSWWKNLRHSEWLFPTIDEFASRVLAMYEEQGQEIS